MYANYHTHTSRCHHATGSDEAYVTGAIQAGFSVLGFSDHSPWPFSDHHKSPIRMDVEELPGYVASLQSLRAKYRKEITLYIGLECEYFPEYFPWLEEQKKRYHLDYVILGNHFQTSDETGFYYGSCRTAGQLASYVEHCIRGMESGEYLYLAHPDLMFHTWPVFDEDARAASRELCRAMKMGGYVLEYNLQGILNHGKHPGTLGYPTPGFWQIASEEGCRVIVGVDAHSIPAISTTREFDQAVAFLRSVGLEPVQSLPIGGEG
jgi:histidinol-phosphatase (PHP family)